MSDHDTTVAQERGSGKRQLLPAAGNGLLGRRSFLRAGLGAGGIALMQAQPASASRPGHMRSPGPGMSEYGSPAPAEEGVKRIGIGSQRGTTGSGASRSPLEHLHGIVTPSGLHFERHHAGVPEIDPAKHNILIHGLVERDHGIIHALGQRYAPAHHCRIRTLGHEPACGRKHPGLIEQHG